MNDDGCRSDKLTCAVGGPEKAFCTARCSDSTPKAEALACGGPGNTCVTQGDGPGAMSWCTRSCKPLAAEGEPGRCPDHTICTGLWFSHADGADHPGCLPLCRDDADCYAGFSCNSRTLGCGAPSDPAGLPDGSPCVPPLLAADINPCRGQCLEPVPGSGEGICASYVRRGAEPACPDGDSIILGDPTTDRIGLCAYTRCTTDDGCQAPLVCQQIIGLTKGCLYP